MKNENEPDGGPVPKWMRLLAKKWRIADKAAAYPHAVPPRLEEPVPDASPRKPAPPRDEPPSSSGQN